MARIALRLLLVVTVLAVSAACLVLVLEIRGHSQSRRLLSDAQSLRVGESTASDIQGFVLRHGGFKADSEFCGTADSCYIVQTGPTVTLNRLFLSSDRFQRWLGVRPWGVNATFQITQSRLSGLLVESIAYTAENDEQLDSRLHIETPGGPGATPYFAHYTVSRGHIHIFEVWITPQANPLERARGFDFDLSCQIAYSGCGNVCQLMPSAWVDYQREPFGKDSPIPAEEVNDPRCNKF
jgi:hypothetical protein